MNSLGASVLGHLARGAAASGQRGEPLSKAVQLMTCAAHSSGLAIAIFGPALRVVGSSEFTGADFLWTGLRVVRSGMWEGGVDNRTVCKTSFWTAGCSRGIARMGPGVPHVGHLSTAGFCGARWSTTRTSSWDDGAAAAARRPPRPVTWPHRSQWQSPQWGWARQCWTGCLMNAGFRGRALRTLVNVRPPHRPFR